VAIKRKELINESNTYTYCFREYEILEFFEEKIDGILADKIKDHNKVIIKIESVDYQIVIKLCELYRESGWNTSYKFEEDYYILTFN
jgi:hypothetical protein